MTAIIGGLVGAAVFVEVQRAQRDQGPVIGLLTARRDLPSGFPVVLADFKVDWQRSLDPQITQYYSDQQWGDLRGASLGCDLGIGEKLRRTCVRFEKFEKKPQRRQKRRSTASGIPVWNEMGE